MTIFDILARLKNVKGPDASGNYLACCPAHDDKKQSLSVKQGDKGVVMKCYAGCGVRDICARLGIEMKDLYEDKPREPQAPKQQRKIVKTYPYTDKDGKLLFEVVRYEPKSFSQRMPDPDKPGQWIWKSCPVQPLYRLPEVNKAIAAGEYVCIAEGEKDASLAEEKSRRKYHHGDSKRLVAGCSRFFRWLSLLHFFICINVFSCYILLQEKKKKSYNINRKSRHYLLPTFILGDFSTYRTYSL